MCPVEELEPLDEIREQLNLAPVQLTELEFALNNWSKRDGKGASSLPSEVMPHTVDGRN